MVKSNEVLTLQRCTEVINDACNDSEAMSFVREISTFHRIQASQGYRAAAERAVHLLKQNGVDVCIHSYPADGRIICFTQKLFKEWNCTEGWLKIILPWQECLSDFNREEMSIIQRSANMDFSDKDIPIIYVENNIVPTDFNISLAGALLFVENDFDKWCDRAIDLGALGIITVSMPEIKPVRINTSEDKEVAYSHANLSFHIYSEEQENKLCGFAISPFSGKRLREACIAMSAEERRPMARFKILSTLTEGFIENVDAVIQGDTDEEILMLAHLCHPRSSVNDNASGVAAAIEAMCALKRLITDGTLPRPHRTIRLLLIPEFTGTYAFLKENESRLSKIVAGINLDMVAGYQNGKAGPIIIVDTPDCAHSFSGDLSSIIMSELSKECNFGGKDIYVPLFTGVKVPFVFGSDHYILSDPTVDIPTVAVTQWPDKTYHTSADSIDHIDPKMLRRSAALAGSYCYIYSRFTLEDAEAVISEISNRFFQYINSLRRNKTCSYAKERCDYIKDVYFATLNRISSLFDEKELCRISQTIEDEKEFFLLIEQISFNTELTRTKSPTFKGGEYLRALSLAHPGQFTLCQRVVKSSKDSIIIQQGLNSPLNEVSFKEEEENLSTSSPIPLRLFKAPLAMRSIIGDMTSYKKEKFDRLRRKYLEYSSLDDFIIYEADGKRTVADISQRVYFQTGVECSNYVKEFFEILNDLGLAKFI